MQTQQDIQIKSLMDKKWRLKRTILTTEKEGGDTDRLRSDLRGVESQLAQFDTFDLIPEDFEDL